MLLWKGIRSLRRDGIAITKRKIKNYKNRKLWGKSYNKWFKKQKVTAEELEKQKHDRFSYEPLISILVPTYNTPILLLRQMVDSVIGQSYPNWQLCIGEGSGGNRELEKEIEAYHKKDPRIVYTVIGKNAGISGNTNVALGLAEGEFVALLDHDDLLEPDALFEVVKKLQDPEVDVVYTDEDKVYGNKLFNCEPNIKPDFSIDLLRSCNYIAHLYVVRTSVAREVGGFRSEYDGSQDYDFEFRTIEKARKIEHVSRVLYHWRMCKGSTAGDARDKLYCYEAGRRAIESHLERTGTKGSVESLHTKGLWGMYHVTYEVEENTIDLEEKIKKEKETL